MLMIEKQLPLIKERPILLRRNGFYVCPKCHGQMMSFKYEVEYLLSCVQCGKEISLKD